MNSELKYCPDCGERIQPGNSHCSDCGWKPNKPSKNQKKGKKEQNNVFDDRKGLCEWEGMERECPAIGAHSTNTKGAGPWYCWKHFTDPGLIEGLKIIDKYEKNGLPDKKSPGRKMMENSLKMGTGIQQKKDESVMDFRKRVLNTANRLF